MSSHPVTHLSLFPFQVIKKGKFKFHDEYWSDISKDARDLIKKMLTLDQDKRPTAAELLKHK